MKRILVLTSACALIAACTESAPDGAMDGDVGAGEGEGSGEEISLNEVQEKISEQRIKPKAGQYRSTAELVSIDIPGAPPEIASMMGEAMKGQTSEYCLTQEDVDKGFEEMAKETQEGDCSFQKFDMDGGDIDAVMSCTAPGDAQMKVAMKGKGTETSMDMTMTLSGKIPQAGEMSMVMKSRQERIGDCS
jgi:hypothetical protein